ncbi:MAG: RraA family protein [Verrucomicrobia bacterium]|nr:RraA family protein [Verrucomicrobiota bacterium]
MSAPLTAEQLKALQALDTCTVANAIETFDLRLRNEGFANQTIRRLTAAPAPMVGHAVTLRIRCSSPPMRGHNYVDRTDWWNHILTIPAPRVVVIQDVDEAPGTGTFLGEVHANILKALGCVGGVTNGAVRDVPAVERTGFQLFAGGVAVSHAYSHIVDFGGPVEIGGLAVNPGDLLHADLHGMLSVPLEIAAQIPAVAAQALERERRVIELCRAKDFSLEKLRAAVKDVFK